MHEHKLKGNLSGFDFAHNRNRPFYCPNYCFTDRDFDLLVDETPADETPDLDELNSELRWRLIIPYAYLRNLITTVSNAVFESWEQPETSERPNPQPWWING